MMKRLFKAYVFVFLLTLCPFVTAEFAALGETPGYRADREYSVAFASFMREVNPDLSPQTAVTLSRRLVYYASEFELDPFVMLALVASESSFNRTAASRAGAKGLTQVIPRWHREKLKAARARFGTDSLFNPDVSLFVGAWVLREYLDANRGNLTRALSQYNGSLGDRTRKYAKTIFRVQYRAKAYHQHYAQVDHVEQFFTMFS